MLYISKWKAIAILLTAFVFCMFAVPNFFSDATLKKWPQWAQRHLVLGLDLQGGSHILLEVDAGAVRKQRLEQLRDEVRRTLRDARIVLHGAPVVRGNSVEVRIRETDVAQGYAKLRELSVPLGGILSATGQRTLDVVNAGGGLITLTLTEPAIVERVRQAVEQSIQIVEKRVNELGTVEPMIQRQGIDRILVQVPGLQTRNSSSASWARPPSSISAWSTSRWVPSTALADAPAAGIGSAVRLADAKAGLPISSRSASWCRAAI